jgi:hypothetical protein
MQTDILSAIKTYCQAGRMTFMPVDRLSYRKKTIGQAGKQPMMTDYKVGTQFVKRTDILSSGKTDCHVGRTTSRQADVLSNRQTYRLSGIETYCQAGRKTFMPAGRLSYRQTDFKTGRQADRVSEIHADNKAAVKMWGMPAILDRDIATFR